MLSALIRNKKLLLITGIALAALIISAAVLMFHSRNAQREQADMLLENREYSAAMEMYTLLGDEEKAALCQSLIIERDYNAARRHLQSGNYSQARTELTALGDYKDCLNLLLACDYLEAEELYNSGEYISAREIYTELADYPGAEAGLTKTDASMYERAMEFAVQGDYEQAALFWSILGDHGDSSKFLERVERMLSWLPLEESELIVNQEKLFPNSDDRLYKTDSAYVVIPEYVDSDCDFFIYFPGGWNKQISIDFPIHYMKNPAPNTIGIFMYKNGSDNMAGTFSEAFRLLDRAAAECGVFPHDIITVGSSLGAYHAMHAVSYARENCGVYVDCAISLDAGSDWDTYIVMDQAECYEAAKSGTEFFLFESYGVGMGRIGIKNLVRAGNDVTMVYCYFDEHERMSMDALRIGFIQWAFGDRTEPFTKEMYPEKLYHHDIYEFVKLS